MGRTCGARVPDSRRPQRIEENAAAAAAELSADELAHLERIVPLGVGRRPSILCRLSDHAGNATSALKSGAF